MRALLDTNAFLWWAADDPKLSTTAREIIRLGTNEIYVSAASVLEIVIKHARGRLELPVSPGQHIVSRMRSYRLISLPIQIDHALQVAVLPMLHRDPIDRILVAQSQVERLSIVTPDQNIARYDVEVIW